MLKLEYHVQLFFITSCIFLCLFQSNTGAFAYCDRVSIIQCFLTHFLKIFMYMRTVCGYIEGCVTVNSGFFVRKPWLFGDETDNVHTESVNALFQPPVHHVKNFLTYNRVVPVQIRLFFGEQVQEIHICCLVIFPCRTGEAGTPVVRKASVFLCRTPDVVISVRVVCGFAALDEPFVFIRGMVYNQVHHDLDAFFVSCGKHTVEVFHGSEFVHDRLIITDIISVVIIW